MKKNNKILPIIIILLAICLLLCGSMIIIHYNQKNNPNNFNVDCLGSDCDTNNNNNDNGNNNPDNNEPTKPVDNNNSENNNSGSNNNESNTGSNSGKNNNSSSGYSNSKPSGNGSGSTNNFGYGNGAYDGVGPSYGSTSSSIGVGSPDGIVTVTDNNEKWGQNSNLKIFNVKSVQPGDSGIYDFYVNNYTDRNIIYDIAFDEENIHGVNLMYKLKMNNKYIAGDEDTWVKYDELDLQNKVLNSGYRDTFKIEWKWVDSENDKDLIKKPNVTYTIRVNVTAHETNAIDVSGESTVNPITGDKIIIYIEIMILCSIVVILLSSKSEKKI